MVFSLKSLRIRKRNQGPAKQAAPGPGDSRPGSSPLEHATAPAASCQVGGTRLVFGLEWSPLGNPHNPEPDLQKARSVGYDYGAVMADGSLVGLTRRLAPGRGKPFSAVLVFIDRLSSAEVEAFIFSVGQRYCFVGLAERRPVPGFDQLLPDLAQARALLTEFRGMHVGHDVRLVSNLGTELPGSEQVVLEQAVAQPDRLLQLSRLINRPLRRTMALISLAVLVVGGGTAWILYQQEQERAAREAAERQAYENDPDRLYEQGIEGLLTQAGTPGNAVLNRWRELVRALPLVQAGWQLTLVECQAIGCKATWVRYHGSFQQFDAQLPPGANAVPALGPVDADTNLLGIQLVTQHPAARPAAAPTPGQAPDGLAPPPALKLERVQLPLQRAATAQWGSLMQDWSLLNARPVLAGPALLSPQNGSDIAPIKRPVVKQRWSLDDGIWSLPYARLPGYVVPETLTVKVAGKDSSYQLTGSLYAKAKDY